MANPTDDDSIKTAVSDGVLTVTLNRPEVMNAFSDGMREALLATLERAGEGSEVRVIVVTGEGRAFCAGGDIASMAELQARDDTSVIEQRMVVAAQVVQLIRRLPQLVIAAVNGAAAGGGMNLALACDLRLGSDRALFSESFVRIGLVPDWGGFSLLPKLVGTAKALELMATGDRIDAQEAYRLGLLNQLHPHGSFAEAVKSFSARIAAGPTDTIARIKQGVYLGAAASFEEGLGYEYRSQRSVFLSENAREGMRAFLEKRPPRFRADE